MRELIIIVWSALLLILLIIVGVNYDSQKYREFNINCIKNWGTMELIQWRWTQYRKIVCVK